MTKYDHYKNTKEYYIRKSINVTQHFNYLQEVNHIILTTNAKVAFWIYGAYILELLKKYFIGETSPCPKLYAKPSKNTNLSSINNLNSLVLM